MDELHFPCVIVLQNEAIVAVLIHLHKVIDIHQGLLFLLVLLELRDDDSAHQRGSLQDLQLGLLEDLSDVVLSDEVEGQSLIRMIPRIWDAIYIT